MATLRPLNNNSCLSRFKSVYVYVYLVPRVLMYCTVELGSSTLSYLVPACTDYSIKYLLLLIYFTGIVNLAKLDAND